MTKPLWLNDQQVRSLLDDPAIAYAAVQEALKCHAHGNFQQPLKPYVRPQGREGEREGGRYIAMPAYLGGQFNTAGIKWIASVPANIDRNLPRASGVVILNSPDTGEVVTIMECGHLSAVRTAAVATIAFDLLAPSGNLEVALLGAGPIGGEILRALAAKPRGVIRYRIFDPRQDRACDAASAIAASSGIEAVTCSSAESAIREADVVITATTGASGYIQREWIKPGSLIVCMSLDDPTEEAFLASKVVVDDFDQCNRQEKLLHRLTKAGRFAREMVHAQLGQLIVGEKQGRTSQAETFLVVPMGMAIEDLAVAKAVFTLAVERGIGTFTN